MEISAIEILLGIIAFCSVAAVVIFAVAFRAMTETMREIRKCTDFIQANAGQVEQLLRESNQQVRSTQRLTEHLDDIVMDVKEISGSTKSVVQQTVLQFSALISGARVGMRSLQRNFDSGSNGKKALERRR